MKKSGELKLKNKCIKFITTIAVVVLTFVFFSCKSLPANNLVPVKTFDMLDDEGALYMHIPAKTNQNFLDVLFTKATKNVDSTSIGMFVSRMGNMYLSIGSKTNKKRYQAAIDMTMSVSSILSDSFKQQGIKKLTYVPESKLADSDAKFLGYQYYAIDNFQIALPSYNQIVFAQDVKPMLNMFDFEQKEVIDLLEDVKEADIKQINSSFENNSRKDWKSSDLYKWISEDTQDIRFYIVRPQSFLANLLGTNVSVNTFKLKYAKGSFAKLPNSKYELTLELEFLESRFIKPATSILMLALGLTDSEISLTSPSTILLKGVHLSVDQVADMF